MGLIRRLHFIVSQRNEKPARPLWILAGFIIALTVEEESGQALQRCEPVYRA